MTQHRSRTSRSRRTALAATIGLTLALTLGSFASAAVITIDGEKDIWGAKATWNPYGEYEYDQCVADQVDGGYMGSEEGAYGPKTDPDAQNDTFDGGLMLVVGGETYSVPSQQANLKNKQITTGPRGLAGLKVWRLDRVLTKSPTMRSLVKLKNTTNNPISRPVVWDSALGADSTADVRGSSSGDMNFTKADRWITGSDDPTTPGDPPAAFQFFGRGNVRSPVDEVLYKPAQTSVPGEACVTVRLRIKVPANSTRYLLFFTQQWSTNEQAKMGIKKVDALSQGHLLADIGSGVRNNILNWNVG
jgi:hypothetical protein